MKLDYLLTWFQSWRWRRFSNFGLRFKMADEDRQSDKMALTALLVVLLVRKIRRRRSRRRKTWAREWILRSQQQGAYPNLLRELNAEDHDAFRQFHRLDREPFKTVLAMVAPFITKIGHKHDFSSMISLSKVSAIFNFEITWASNPISLANWLIWLSPIHTFTAHGEESAFQGQKYQTWQIFSSQPRVAKFSDKLRRTREETA